MKFSALTPTDEAKAAMLKVIAGYSLTFTRIGLGNGDKPDSIDELTELNNRICYGSITGYTANDTTSILEWSLSLSEENVPSSFDWREYGLYATTTFDDDGNVIQNSDGTIDGEFLFSYAYDDTDNPQKINNDTETGLITLTAEINIFIGAADNIGAIIIGDYDIAALSQNINSHIEDTDNPHNVTAEQLGLEDVDNVSTNNATPTFTEASALENIESGETASTLWGKVKKAISNLISHIENKSNPHSVTASQVGAAASSHTHSASDISSGTLAVARGGTGVTSLSSLLTAMVTTAKQNITLANARYLYGKNTSGTSTALIGMNSDNALAIGADGFSGGTFIHSGDDVWARVPSSINSSYYAYARFSTSGNFYPRAAKRSDVSEAGNITKISSSAGGCIGTSDNPWRKGFFSGGISTSSDRKTKENISKSEIGLAFLKKLSYVDFNLLNDDTQRHGLIAQDVFEVCQELGLSNSAIYTCSLVGKEERLTDDEIKKHNDDDLIWSLDYQQITNLCLSGFHSYMEETESRLEALEKQIGGND